MGRFGNMKKYPFMVLLVGFCFGQTIADLNAEQKLQYNRNKLSIDVVQKTIGGVAGNAVHSESWNQWTAYKGLRNKINEYEFFTITGYENEANTIKENYIKSKSEQAKSEIMFVASLSLYATGWFLIDGDLKLPILIGNNSNIIYNHLFIFDLVKAVCCSLKNPKTYGKIYNINGDEEVTLISGIRMNSFWGNAQYSISNEGTLAYISGTNVAKGIFAWVHRDGTIQQLEMLNSKVYCRYALNSAGSKVAAPVSGERADIFVFDLKTGSTTPITRKDVNLHPIWSPDDSKIIYTKTTSNAPCIIYPDPIIIPVAPEKSQMILFLNSRFFDMDIIPIVTASIPKPMAKLYPFPDN